MDTKNAYPKDYEKSEQRPLFDGVVLKLGTSKYTGQAMGIGPATTPGHIEVNMGTLTSVSMEKKDMTLLQYDHFHSEAHCTKNEEGAANLKVVL